MARFEKRKVIEDAEKEKKKREEAERKKHEEAERKKREQEERKRREEEERKKREEEARKRQEEEERKRRERAEREQAEGDWPRPLDRARHGARHTARRPRCSDHRACRRTSPPTPNFSSAR